MAFSRIFLIFLCPFAIHFAVLAIAQPKMLYKDCTVGNYSTGSTYQTNLNNLLTSIYTNTEINNGFYNSSYGQDPEKVYAIALCRPDISPDDCRSCVKNASDSLLTLCPNYNEAIGGQDNCMVRYSNRSIFGVMAGVPYFWVYGQNNVSDVNGFSQSRMILLNNLSNVAAGSAGSDNNLSNVAAVSDSRYKYATGEIDAPNSQKIYALVQCTPDLSKQDCFLCLNQATELLPECCNNRQGGRVIKPSCNFRYEINLFYNFSSPVDLSPSSPPPLPTTVVPSPPPTSSAKKGPASNITPTLIIGSFLILLL